MKDFKYIFIFSTGILLLNNVYSLVYYTVNPIDNIYNLSSKNDIVNYSISILNKYNDTIYVYPSSLSPSWIVYFKPNFLVIPPQTSKKLYIVASLRPEFIKEKNIIYSLDILLSIYNKSSNSFLNSYQIILQPIIFQKKEINTSVILPKNSTNLSNKTIKKLEVLSYLNNKEISAGDSILMKIIISNPYNSSKDLSVYINPPFGFKKEIKITVPANKTIELIIKIPTFSNIIPDKYNLNLKIVSLKDLNVIYNKSFKIKISNKYLNDVNIIHYNNEIIIKNPNDIPVYYKYKVPYTILDKILYNYDPNPSYIINENGKKYAVWNILLLPRESYTIKKEINYKFILLFIVFYIILLGIYYLYTRIPKLSVKKEILKVDPKNQKIKIMISIKNLSNKVLKNIKVIEPLFDIFKLEEEYDSLIPKKVIKNGKSYLVWEISELKPKEEVVLTYTLKYIFEILGDFILEPTKVEVPFAKKYKLIFLSDELKINFEELLNKHNKESKKEKK